MCTIYTHTHDAHNAFMCSHLWLYIVAECYTSSPAFNTQCHQKHIPRECAPYELQQLIRIVYEKTYSAAEALG